MPFAETSTDVTSPKFGIELTMRPESTSQKRTVPSLQPDSTMLPCAEYARHVTLASCP